MKKREMENQKIEEVEEALLDTVGPDEPDECTACGEPLSEERRGESPWCEDCEARFEEACAED